MPNTAQVVWSLAILVNWCIALAIAGVRWSATNEFAELQKFRMRLPLWLGTVERLVLAVVLGVLITVLVLMCGFLYRAAHHLDPTQKMGELAIVLLGTASAIGAVAPAALIANAVSWYISPMRAANERAMEGLNGITFKRLNAQLARFALAISVACVIQVAIAIMEPWR